MLLPQSRADLLHLRRVGPGALHEAAIAPHDLGGRVAAEVQEGLVGEHDGIVRLPRVRDDHRHPGAFDGDECQLFSVGKTLGRGCGWRLS
jgi:hypothetical protein